MSDRAVSGHSAVGVSELSGAAEATKDQEVVRSAVADSPAASAGPAAAPATAEEGPHQRVDAAKLESALLGLRRPIVELPLHLEVPEVGAARAERAKLLSQIDDYLLPRLRKSGAPILVALVGSTGAGKSTLVNSLVGKQVSATGIRRPTTNSPVLACHPDDIDWFAENVFLPTLPRVRQQGLAMPGRDGLLVLAACEQMPQGVALLDTPDIDSVVQAHREFAHQFLDASDLWLFMTSAARYADAAVWDLLRHARDRNAALAVVLSRVPPFAVGQLTAHFDAMLDANGFAGISRFVIPETLIADDRLPEEVYTPIRAFLQETAETTDRRLAVLTQTMLGVLGTFRSRVPALAGHAERQRAARSRLRAEAQSAYASALADFDEAITDGSLLDGEVLARWQDFTATGDLLRMLQARRPPRFGRRGKRQQIPARAIALKAAVRAAIEALIASVAIRAAEETSARWQRSPAGAALLSGHGEPAGPAWNGQPGWAATGCGLATRAARAVSAWQDQMLRMVQAENVTKRSVGRAVSFDDESLALVLTIGLLSSGMIEVGPQRMLTSLFGAGPLRDLGVRARRDLRERVELLLSEEMLGYTARLDAAGVPDETAAVQLYQAVYTLETLT
jgi:energy-coupling factor transporter ATP-binding protein EcfA2